MAEGSLIGWLNRPGYEPWTLNVGIGCTPVSSGCDFCYAPNSAGRQAHLEGRDGVVTKDALGRSVWTGKVVLFPERLKRPRRVKKPHMIFINALMDLFAGPVGEEFIAQVWQMMADTPQHIYVILTKQPKRMRDIARRLVARFGILPNVWLGVSAEDQHTAETRIRFLIETPAAVRAVSAEPLLGPIDLTRLHLGGGRYLDALAGDIASEAGEVYAAAPGCIDWVIAGGESGRRADARPMHPAWARSLRDQAVCARRAFFFKQWGNWGPAPWSVSLPADIERRYAEGGAAGGQRAATAVLAKATRDAEAIGATHYYSPQAHLHDWQIGEAGHKTWSSERHPLADNEPNAPMRFYRGKTAGHDLDGRAWQQWPTRDGLIVEAPSNDPGQQRSDTRA